MDEGIADFELEDDFAETKPTMPNPLLISMVLEKVFGFSDMPSLAEHRLVCGNWKQEARNAMRRRCCVKFTTVEQIKAYIDEMSQMNQDDSAHEIYQFGTLCNTRCPGFVTGIRRARRDTMIDSSYFNPNYREIQANTLRSFFNIFGGRIRILELDTEPEVALPELRRILAEETPNLETLSMTIRYTQSPRLFTDDEPFLKPRLTTLSLRSDVGMVPVFLLRDFFIMAPNLQKVTCLPIFTKKWKYSTRQPAPGRVDFSRVLFHTIVLGPNPPPLQNLSNLDINLQLTETELQGLIKMAFPLRSIKLGICADVRGATVGNFLNAGRNRLARVSLNFHPSSDAASYNRFNFELIELRHLCLCGFKGPIIFVRNCPALKTLIVAQSGNLLRTFPVYDLGPHKLEKLFVQWDDLENPLVIGRITMCFPQLKVFAMRKGNDCVMREIYLNMPFLEELTILGGGFTDEGITGITRMVYQDIAETGSLPITDAGKLRTSMSIGSLSRLRKLYLESELITNVSIYLGIGGCVNLQHLHLQCNLLTDYCLWKFIEFPYLSRLNLVTCSGLTLENKVKMRNIFRAQNRNLHIEWTLEEVFRESSRRALILPDLPHDYYQQAVEGRDMNEEQNEADADPDYMGGIDGPPPPGLDIPDSDEDDDNVDDLRPFDIRRRARLPFVERLDRDALLRAHEDRGGRNRQRLALHLVRGAGWRQQQQQQEFQQVFGAHALRQHFPPDVRREPGIDAAERPADGVPNPGRIIFDEVRFHVGLPAPQPPRPNADQNQIGPRSPEEYPPPIPVDLDTLDDVEM